VLFTRNLKYKAPEIAFNGDKLALNSNFKHLGVIIDSKLSWCTHSNYVKSKVLQFTNNLLRFAKTNYGLGSRSIEVIYKGAILPTIGYAVSTWVDAVDRKFVLKPLESLQRLIAIRMTKSYKTVSHNAANVLANFVPIDLWLKLRAIDYFIKKNINHKLMDEYFANTPIKGEIIQRPIDFKTLLHFSDRKPITITDRPEEGIAIYVESKKNNRGVGCALEIRKNEIIINKKFKLAKYCSQFQGLLLATLRAIEIIKAKNWRSMSATIHTRSRALVQALQDPQSTTEIISKIFKSIHEMRANDITFNVHLNVAGPVPGGPTQSAIDAIDSNLRIEYDMIPIGYVKRTVREKTIELWDRRWQSSTTGAQTKKIFNTIQERIGAKKHFQSNYHLSQALTSHGSLYAYLHRFNIKDDAICGYCGTGYDDADHRIYDCEYFGRERQELIAQIESEGLIWPLRHSELINNKCCNYFRAFCQNVFK
jgi:hypothetical protein